jgi:two-component sensor histidine kinase
VDRSVGCECRCEAVYCTLEKAIPFGLLLNELVTNAFKVCDPGAAAGEISVSLRQMEGTDGSERFDNGPGLPPDFDPAAARGLGLQLVRALVSQLGGEISWENDAARVSGTVSLA